MLQMQQQIQALTAQLAAGGGTPLPGAIPGLPQTLAAPGLPQVPQVPGLDMGLGVLPGMQQMPKQQRVKREPNPQKQAAAAAAAAARAAVPKIQPVVPPECFRDVKRGQMFLTEAEY